MNRTEIVIKNVQFIKQDDWIDGDTRIVLHGRNRVYRVYWLIMRDGSVKQAFRGNHHNFAVVSREFAKLLRLAAWPLA